MTKTEAAAITGGLSSPSKGKGIWRATSLPASACPTGAKLAQRPGSICNDCMALKGRYVFPGVQNALQRRLAALSHTDWVRAMVTLIGDALWFRWHDSGDIQNRHHFASIVQVARETPRTHHWLPTQERAIVREYKGAIPPNLIIRFSAVKPDRLPVLRAGELGSTVHTADPIPGTYPCPARETRHPKTGEPHCGSCRACWDPTIRIVSYPHH